MYNTPMAIVKETIVHVGKKDFVLASRELQSNKWRQIDKDVPGRRFIIGGQEARYTAQAVQVASKDVLEFKGHYDQRNEDGIGGRGIVESRFEKEQINEGNIRRSYLGGKVETIYRWVPSGDDTR